MLSLTTEAAPGEPVEHRISGDLLTRVEFITVDGKSSYQFYEYGEGRVLSVVRFNRAGGGEIASYAGVALKNQKSIELSLFNCGAIDSTELPRKVEKKLENAVL